MSHRQAYFDSPEPRAASPSLGPAALAALGELYTGEDGFRVDAVEGVGMVASRTIDGLTHMLVGPFDGLLGIELWGARHWGEELTTLESAPPEPEPSPALMEAVLSGDPVVLVEPDEARRAAFIAWVCFALPRAEAERLTFTTFSTRPTGLGVTATTPEHADAFDGPLIDATTPADPGHYTRIALELTSRGTLATATRNLEAPDPVALAIAGGATDLLTPEDLPRALELITALAQNGDIATAARAAAAIPDGTEPAGAVLVDEVAVSVEEPVSLRELEAAVMDVAQVDELVTDEPVSLVELEQSLRRRDEDEGS